MIQKSKTVLTTLRKNDRTAQKRGNITGYTKDVNRFWRIKEKSNFKPTKQ
jgi:hypothetical protein